MVNVPPLEARAEPEIDLSQLLYVLLRRLWAILLLTAIGAGAAYYYATLTSKVLYTATTSLVVNAKYNQSYTGKDEQAPSTADINLARDLTETYKLVLRSDRIMRYVIDKLALGSDVDTLMRQVELTNVEKTQVFFITVTDENPDMAVRIANAIAEVAPQVMMETVDIGSVNVLDAAQEAKLVPNGRLHKTLLGALAGLLLGGGIVFAIAWFCPRVRNAADVRKCLGTDTIGEVQRQRQRGRKSVLYNDANATIALKEAFQYQSAVLKHRMEREPIKRLLVTSALADEGKTYVALNLCLALASGGMRVALLDFDTRKQSIRRLLRVDPRKVGDFTTAVNAYDKVDGLGHCLAEVVPGFAVVPFVTVPESAESEFLASAALEDMLNVLDQYFDLIVFDSMPAYPVAATVELARMTDGVLMVVRQDSTSCHILTETKARLEKGGAKVLGVVINDIRHRHWGSGYAYRSGMYYQ